MHRLADFDRDIGGFVLAKGGNWPAAPDDQLAAAVERYGPGRWGIPVR